MIVLVSLRVGTTAPHAPMKMAEGAQSGPMLLAMVEFVMSISPSVWKIAPPCQPVDGVAADRAVYNVEGAQGANAATNISGCISADRAAQYLWSIEEAIDAAARPAGVVVRHTAVDQVELGAIAVIDSAATLPEISGIRLHGIFGDDHMIECQRSVIDDAACQAASRNPLRRSDILPWQWFLH